MPDVTQEGCVTRMALGGFSGAVLGGVYGSIISAWQQACTVKEWAADACSHRWFVRKIRWLIRAAVGAVHGIGSCFAEELTGGKGVVSGAIGALLLVLY